MAARTKARKRALDVLFESEVRGLPLDGTLEERLVGRHCGTWIEQAVRVAHAGVRPPPLRRHQVPGGDDRIRPHRPTVEPVARGEEARNGLLHDVVDCLPAVHPTGDDAADEPGELGEAVRPVEASVLVDDLTPGTHASVTVPVVTERAARRGDPGPALTGSGT